MTKMQHNSNRELIGGLPGAGATMHTVVNIQAGGTGRLSSVVHALILIVVILITRELNILLSFLARMLWS